MVFVGGMYAESNILNLSSKSKRFRRAGPVDASKLRLLRLFLLRGIGLLLRSLLALERPNVDTLLRA
jgi:hypothetical protein